MQTVSCDKTYGWFILFVSLLVALLGIAVIIGWLLDIQVLKSDLAGYNSMKFNTALGFFFLGSSFFLYVYNPAKKWVPFSRFFILPVLVLGLLSFSQDFFKVNVGLDQFFIIDKEMVDSNSPFPGRIHAGTAWCFIWMVIGYFGMDAGKQLYRIIAQVSFHLVTLFSFVAITGYLFNIPGFYKLTLITSMAVHTAIAFFFLSVTAALLNPSLGIAGLFTGQRIGNKMARRLFSQVAAAILILAYIRIWSNRQALVSVEFGIALFALSFLLTCLFLIWTTANKLNSIDLKRDQAENGLFRIKTFLDSTPDPIVIVDSNGIIQLTNDQVKAVFGYRGEELTGQKIEVLLPARFRNNHEAHLHGYFTDSNARVPRSGLKSLALKREGSEFPVEISLNPIETSDGFFVSAAIRDVTQKNRDEEKFREVSDRLLIATKTSAIGIWDYYPATNRLIWDDSMFKLYAITSASFAGNYEAWKDLVHPDDLIRAHEAVQASLYSEKEYDIIFRVTLPGSSTHYMRSRATVYRDDTGNAFRMLGTNVDITDLKRAELDLAQSNERNQIFVQQSPNAIAMFDQEMQYMAASAKWLKDYHLEGRDIIGHSHYDIFPEIGDDWKAIHQAGLQGEVNTCEEAAFERADGSAQWITWDVRPWYISEGNIGGLLMYTADITHLKEKDQEKRRIESILDKSNEVARIGTWDVNINTGVVTWSRITREIHEVSPDYEPELNAAINFFEATSREKIRNAYLEAVKHGTNYDLELELVTASGNITWVRAIGQAEFKDGVCKRVYGIFQDINEIKKAAKEMKSLNQITADQNERLKNFAHIVSHNLRSHSGNIDMLLALFLRKNPGIAEDEILRHLTTASGKLKETIANLNEVVLMNNSLEQNLVPIYLHRAIESATNNISQLAKEASVKIINQVDESVSLLALPAYLDSILLNFITNGIKYRSMDREGKVVISATAQNNYIVIIFEDNGIGIDLNRNGAKLFGMYKTFHGNKDARGIGLFITKNQVEAMGGKVEVESELGKGSIFKIYLKHG